jgi:hypothetical protein
MARKISVIDVIRSMKVDPEPQLCWTVGALTREAWRSEYGELPEKQLRPKTSGGGTHCFAVYPASWRHRIAKFVSAYKTQAAKQGDLGL